MYEETRHAALIEEDWDANRVVQVIDEIVRDTRERFDQHSSGQSILSTNSETI
jgi:hypothetical protein